MTQAYEESSDPPRGAEAAQSVPGDRPSGDQPTGAKPGSRQSTDSLPVYRRWWFWVGVLVLPVVALVAMGVAGLGVTQSTAVLSTLVTTAAVVVGGIWAYYKFDKARTFRPHVEIATSTRWLAGRDHLIQVSVTLRNVGSAKVEVVHEGTGLDLSGPASDQPDPPAEVAWEKDARAYDLFTKHSWIEPGEHVLDELLIRLVSVEDPLRLQVRVVLAWQPKNIVIHARRVISVAVPDSQE